MRNISGIRGDNYGREGFSHITVAGSLMHGFKEVIIVQFICFCCLCLSIIVILEQSCFRLSYYDLST